MSDILALIDYAMEHDADTDITVQKLSSDDGDDVEILGVTTSTESSAETDEPETPSQESQLMTLMGEDTIPLEGDLSDALEGWDAENLLFIRQTEMLQLIRKHGITQTSVECLSLADQHLAGVSQAVIQKSIEDDDILSADLLEIAQEGIISSIKDTLVRWFHKAMEVASNFASRTIALVKAGFDKIAAATKRMIDYVRGGGDTSGAFFKDHPIATMFAALAVAGSIAGVFMIFSKGATAVVAAKTPEAVATASEQVSAGVSAKVASAVRGAPRKVVDKLRKFASKCSAKFSKKGVAATESDTEEGISSVSSTKSDWSEGNLNKLGVAVKSTFASVTSGISAFAGILTRAVKALYEKGHSPSGESFSFEDAYSDDDDIKDRKLDREIKSILIKLGRFALFAAQVILSIILPFWILIPWMIGRRLGEDAERKKEKQRRNARLMEIRERAYDKIGKRYPGDDHPMDDDPASVKDAVAKARREMKRRDIIDS